MENKSLVTGDIEKKDIPASINAIIEAATSGEQSCLLIMSKLKWLEKVVEGARKEILQQAINERQRYGKEVVKLCGFEITEMESGISYDFTNCNDAAWSALNLDLEIIKSSMKEREAFLKGLKEPLELINTETGEITKVYPPVKKSTTTLKIS